MRDLCPDCGGEVLTDGATMWCEGTCGMVQTMPGQLLHAAQMDEIRAAMRAGFEPLAPGDGPSQPHRGASLLQLARSAASHMRSARAERDALQMQVAALSATVDGLLARTRAKPLAEHHGTGDVWAAIIDELPEGAARDLADQRRERGLETHGVTLPLRTLAESLADRREELGDAAAYGVAVAVHKLLAGDEDGAINASYEAGRHLQQGSGVGDVRVGYAVWRAVKRLARGAR